MRQQYPILNMDCIKYLITAKENGEKVGEKKPKQNRAILSVHYLQSFDTDNNDNCSPCRKIWKGVTKLLAYIYKQMLLF